MTTSTRNPASTESQSIESQQLSQAELQRGFIFVDYKTKHLEFIQQGIDRMGSSSILLKGWTIILAATMLGLFADQAQVNLVSLVVCLPVIGFWILDGYFVSQQRLARALHNHVRMLAEEQIDFSMDTSVQEEDPQNGLVMSMFMSNLIVFYVPMIVVVIGLGIVSG